MKIRKVGVIGCGAMGSGITQVCAESGYSVVASDLNDELVKKGIGSIDKALTRNVERGRMSQENKDTIMGRIKGTINTKDFSDCDLIIEAAIENLNAKKKIFAELDKVCPKDAILSSNTSCLSIIDVARATNRLDKVIGLHFFNPAPVMKLLEIVRTLATSDETIATAQEFGKSVGKTTVIAPDIPGFIVNRLLIPFMLDATRMLEAGTATEKDIDTAITTGLNYPMGPFTLADLIGLDIALAIADDVYNETKDPRFVAPTLLRKMVAAGWLGRKTGKGFYDYAKNKNR